MTDFTKDTVEDLRKMVADKREALRVFRFEGAGSRTRNVREGRNIRREIAQMLTQIRARELAEKKAGVASKTKTK